MTYANSASTEDNAYRALVTVIGRGGVPHHSSGFHGAPHLQSSRLHIEPRLTALTRWTDVCACGYLSLTYIDDELMPLELVVKQSLLSSEKNKSVSPFIANSFALSLHFFVGFAMALGRRAMERSHFQKTSPCHSAFTLRGFTAQRKFQGNSHPFLEGFDAVFCISFPRMPSFQPPALR